MAINISSAVDDHNPLGQRWLESFLRRQSRISPIIDCLIEVARVDAASPERIKAWMEFYHGIRTAYKINYGKLCNVDEASIDLSICDNTKVLVRSGKKKTYKNEPSTREWVSVIKD